MKIIELIKAECVMLFGELKQYYLNYIFYNLSLLIIFIGLFYSFNGVRDKDAILLLFGLITWQLCTSALGYLSGVIQDESMLGTLEQIFMTRTSVFSVFTSKVVVSCIFGIAKGLILFVICLFIFKVQVIFVYLGVKNLYMLLIILFTVASFYALGMMFGGMALFYKRVQSLVSMLTYLLLFFTNITIPIEKLPYVLQPISYIIPISWATKCMNNILNSNYSVDFLHNLLGLIISALLYVIIGYIFFKKSIKKAKMLGKLGQY